ncbi:MAG: hypothetical protein QM759_16985 [Terricaulis sp.]
MFVGHYAAAFAAKAVEPRTPLWVYALGAQLVDIGWAGLVAAGVEHTRVDESLPGSPLVLYDMPWTHSLPAAVIWSVAAALLCIVLLRVSLFASVVIALTVFSHWFLDFLVHRPDLLLYPGGPKVGLALWNLPVPEQAVEMGLLALTGAWWVGTRVRLGRTIWPALVFMALLIGLQILAMFSAPAAGEMTARTGITDIAVYLAVTLIAVFVDVRAKRAAIG